MHAEEVSVFYLLKKEVERTYRQAHPACQTVIQDWKGQDITNFQEHLQNQVKGRISEKWFYTHIKPEQNPKLPRIDMLNMLSRYVGYEDWQTFLYKNRPPNSLESVRLKGNSKIKWVLGAAMIALLGVWVWAFAEQEAQHSFCFRDATTGKALIDPLPEVWVLVAEESPKKLSCDTSACIQFPATGTYVDFVVSAPYYHTDTIRRKLADTEHEEEINLHADDYALMIHYFSTNKQLDWEKRRAQLDQIFSEEARIFQVAPNQSLGMELFNKKEFIDKLTTPVRSLGQIEVLETKYKKGKIVGMRFVQKKRK